MKPYGHIFIVGLPRTGTSLMRKILNSSDQIGISRGESHFFGDIRLLGLGDRPGFRQRFKEAGDLSTDAGAKRVVDCIYDIHQNVFWNWIRENVECETFLQRLIESDRTDRSLFDLAMAFHANSRAIRGEKTPAHIHFIPTLLEWFPNAKIIHMFRDPRAVYFSLKNKSRPETLISRRFILRRPRLIFELSLGLNVIFRWLHAIRLHHRYQQSHSNNYYLCQYEDLIRDPDTNLKRLCRFLSINYDEKMLQQTVINSSFVSPSERVKGFDTSAINRWQKHLHPTTRAFFVLLCKKHLLEFGYYP